MTGDNWMLFYANYADGTQIAQNQEDIGTVEGRNCFFDVLEKEKETPLISFVLANGTHSFGVDLVDGHFEVNGVPFFMHDLKRTEADLKNFRIIYFRNVEQITNVTVDPDTGEPLDGTVLAVKVGYTIGWQANDETGKNIQKYIKVV